MSSHDEALIISHKICVSRLFYGFVLLAGKAMNLYDLEVLSFNTEMIEFGGFHFDKSS